MSKISLVSSNSRFNVSQKRLTKIINGLEQGNLEVALKMNLRDKFKDFFINHGIKKNQLKELFGILECNSAIDKSIIDVDNSLKIKSFPNIRAVAICIAVHSLIELSDESNSIKDKLVLEKTSSGFDTGRLTYTINDKAVWISEELLPVEKAVIFETDEIVDKDGNITMKLDNQGNTQMLANIYIDMDKRIEDIQVNSNIINMRLSFLKSRIDKITKSLLDKKDIGSALKTKFIQDAKTWFKLLNKTEYNLKKQPRYAETLANYVLIVQKLKNFKLIDHIQYDYIIKGLLDASKKGGHNIIRDLAPYNVDAKVFEVEFKSTSITRTHSQETSISYRNSDKTHKHIRSKSVDN